MAIISTGNGSDSVTGTSSSDVISSGNGNDTVDAGAGNDTVDGGNGDDVLNGGSGDDTVLGGNGEDIFIHNVSENIDANNITFDFYDGGRGSDTLKFIVTQQQANDLAAAIAAFNASNKSTLFNFQLYVPYLDLKVINIEKIVLEISGSSNHNPVAAADTNLIAEDSVPVLGNVLSNDTDSDVGDLLSVTQVQFGTSIGALGTPLGGVYGSLTLNANGSYSYALNNVSPVVQALAVGESHNEVFTYTISDGQGGTASATLTIMVNGTNDLPIAQNSIQAVNEGALLLNGNVVATDVDHGAVLTYSLVNPAPAGLIFNPDGSFSFDPTNVAYDHLAQGVVQVLNIPYMVMDEQGAQDFDTLTINITGSNDAPVAVAQSKDVNEGGALLTGQLVATDVDDGTVLTFSLVNPAPAGFILNPNGSYSFDPTNAAYDHLAQGVQQVLSIPYNVVDQFGALDSKILTIDITGTNDGPVAVNASANVVEEGPLLIGNLVANDPDDGAALTFSTADVVAGFILNPDGSYSFDPSDPAYHYLNAGDTLDILVHFDVQDQFLASSAGILTIHVAGVTNNLPPVAVADLLMMSDVVNAAAASAGNILSNDADDASGIFVTNVDFVSKVVGDNFDPGDVNIIEIAPNPGMVSSFQVTISGLMANDGPSEVATINVNAAGDVSIIKNAAFDAMPTGVNLDLNFSYAIQDAGGLTANSTFDLRITGTDNNDVFIGSAGADTINAGIGIDLIIPKEGNDVLDGGAGADKALYSHDVLSTDVRNYIEGMGSAQAAAASIPLQYSLFLTTGFANIQDLTGSDGNDKIVANTTIVNGSSIEVVDFGSELYNLITGQLSIGAQVVGNFGQRDLIIGGNTGGTILIGDLPTNLTGNTISTSNDILVTGTFSSGSSTYYALGDAQTNDGTITSSGNDVLFGGEKTLANASAYLIGDMNMNSISGFVTLTGKDVLVGGINSGASGIYYLVGDVYQNNGTLTTTGKDILLGSTNSGAGIYYLIGDVFVNSTGPITTSGNDILVGGSNTSGLYTLVGDVQTNSSNIAIDTAGNDTLTGGANSSSNYWLIGDIDANSRILNKGGDDTLTGGTNSGTGLYLLLGDVRTNGLATINTAGNDILTGGLNSGSGKYVLSGDVDLNGSPGVFTNAGDDTLNGNLNAGAGTYLLIGDIQTNDGILTNAGDDTLIGGANNGAGLYYLFWGCLQE